MKKKIDSYLNIHRGERYIHLELKELFYRNLSSFKYMLAIAAITYFVRVLSYSEPGALYTASAVFVISYAMLQWILVPSLLSGKRKIKYKYEYPRKLKTAYTIYLEIVSLSIGVFVGNITYYFSRARIWEEPTQLLKMFAHLNNPLGALIGFGLITVLYIWLFLWKPYIGSAEYDLRMRGKVEKLGLGIEKAHMEVMNENSEMLEFEELRKAGEKERAKAEKKKRVENREEAWDEPTNTTQVKPASKLEQDLFEAAKIRRGDD